MDLLVLARSTGLAAATWGEVAMLLLCLGLLWLAIARRVEPLLLIPIGVGGILANAPGAGIADPGGFLHLLSSFGLGTSLFPLLIFIGVGSLTDFGPLLANPRILLLGGAAQFGIFATLIGAVALGTLGLDIDLRDAAAIGIIGGADGPTSIYVASKLAPDRLGPIAVAAYSYMALVPVIQPPIVRALTTAEERRRPMRQLREVGRRERILFPVTLLLLTVVLLPDAVPLVGALAFGNLVRESGVAQRLTETASGPLINIVTILLGLAVGSKMSAHHFLQLETLAILALGLVAFSFGTAAGVVMGKVMHRFAADPVNPVIGAAGVSAVPMAARVAMRIGQREDPNNMLLMQAMGPNVAGVLGSAVAAGILISLLGG